MSDPMIAALAQLIETSLAQWQIGAHVTVDVSEIKIAAPAETLSIVRAPAGMPFRWVIMVNERRRTAASVNGILRIVRQTFAPGYQPLRLRIAPLPVPQEAAT